MLDSWLKFIPAIITAAVGLAGLLGLAASVTRNWVSPTVESQSNATLESVGTASFKSSICLPPSSGRSRKNPVRLPPGRPVLFAHLFAMGSLSRSIATIGIALVALISAWIA
jgi:hypothetical protein